MSKYHIIYVKTIVDYIHFYILLDKIKPESAAILMDRFLEGKTVMSISQRMQVTKRQTQRKLKDAIEEFQIVLNTK